MRRTCSASSVSRASSASAISIKPRLVLRQDFLRTAVGLGDEALDLVIDLERRVLAVVLVLRDLAAEEDLLFLLAEGERAHRIAHAPLAHHLASEIGRTFEIVAGAGRDAAERDLLSDAAAEKNADWSRRYSRE
jgi:hypothetical protein